MASGEKKPARSRAVLTDISSRAWEHPADKGALVALRKLKGFDVLLKTMSGVFRERAWRLTLLGSAVLVDERQFARLHRLLAEVGRSLDVSDLPEMYVAADPALSAATVGMDRPVIVLSSGLVHHLDDDELRFVIGHELGHAVSGHAVYRTLLMRLLGLGGLLYAVPGGAIGIRMVTVGLLEWSRKAELSADRAGLLATQDPTAALRTHMKIASGGTLDELDVTSFLQQGAQYDEGGDVRESLIKLSLLQQQSHPFLDGSHLAYFVASDDAGADADQQLAAFAEPWREAYPEADVDRALAMAPLADLVFQTVTFAAIAAATEDGAGDFTGTVAYLVKASARRVGALPAES